MPRLRDPDKDPWPRFDHPFAGGEEYDVHSQGYGSRPTGPTRGTPEGDGFDSPESSDDND